MWQCSWSHPCWGPLLASCSYDRRVVIQREISQGQWAVILSFEGHSSSVNSIAWAPYENGLLLAAASSDGRVSVLAHRGEESESERALARRALDGYYLLVLATMTLNLPCGDFFLSFRRRLVVVYDAVGLPAWRKRCFVGPGVSHWRWVVIMCISMFIASVERAPPDSYSHIHSITAVRLCVLACVGRGPGGAVQRLASAGCDNKVRVYRHTAGSTAGVNGWECETTLSRHRDWVRDVAWAPGSGISSNLLASCSDDGTVCIWRQSTPGGDWTAEVLPPFPAPVWRVSWSVTGNLLAVSCGDNSVTLWKEALSGHAWQQVSSVPDPTLPAAPRPSMGNAVAGY